MDEMSMIGRLMLGKIEFRTQEVFGVKKLQNGKQAFLGAKDAVMSGDPKQIQPVGDFPLYWEGAYTGKGQNKPPGARERPADAWSPKQFVEAALEVRQTFDDVAYLATVSGAG